MSTYRRLTQPPAQSFFLLGMRGVGKSTWARSTFPNATFLDLLDELLAIEVKSTDRYHIGLLKSLRRLDELPGLVRRVLLYTGNRPFRSADGIDIWPADRFASTVAADELWP